MTITSICKYVWVYIYTKIPGHKEPRKKKSLRFSKFGKGQNGENQIYLDRAERREVETF
jgi:hypothetical protein